MKFYEKPRFFTKKFDIFMSNFLFFEYKKTLAFLRVFFILKWSGLAHRVT